MLQEAWAFDGARKLVTAHRVQLKGGIDMPRDRQAKLEVTVRGVPVYGKGRSAEWQVRHVDAAIGRS
jgi:hypothetical protein